MTKERTYEANDWVLYLHRNNSTGEIFYVGIGQKQRATNFRERNFLWKSYVEKHGLPQVELYKTNLSFLEAQYMETFFIDKMGRKINNSGSLTNLTIGGEGVRGLKKTEKQLESIRQLNKSRPRLYGKDNPMFGRVVSQETKDKISKRGRGRKQSPEHIAKRALAKKGKRMNQASIDKMAATLRGRILSEEHKNKISEGMSKVWDSEEFVDKMRLAHKGKITNIRKVLDSSSGVVYNSLKEAAIANGISISYFAGMMARCFTNKTKCVYLEPRESDKSKKPKNKKYVNTNT